MTEKNQDNPIEELEQQLKTAREEGTYKEVMQLQTQLNKLKLAGTFKGMYYQVREGLVEIEKDESLDDGAKVEKAKELFKEAVISINRE